MQDEVPLLPAGDDLVFTDNNGRRIGWNGCAGGGEGGCGNLCCVAAAKRYKHQEKKDALFFHGYHLIILLPSRQQHRL